MRTRRVLNTVLVVFLASALWQTSRAQDDEEEEGGCDWTLPCGNASNVNPDGGCLNATLGNISECQQCNFIFNSAPCENTAENMYTHRTRLFGDSPHYNEICGGDAGSQNSDYDDAPWEDPDLQCGPICALSNRPPFQSIALLETCYRYYERTCCYIIQDTEIDDFYFSLLEAGDRCADELVYPKLKLRDAFCLGCDPNQGKYLIDGKVNICKSLAVGMQPWMFDACGLLLLEERGMPWLGDDTVTPSEHWPDTTSFLNDPVGAHPVYLDDYEVQIIDNCVSECRKDDPNSCTVYDIEYVACARINDNVTTPCYDPDINSSASVPYGTQWLSIVFAFVLLQWR